jgi:two-component system, sensor histidine kinase PdtaS
MSNIKRAAGSAMPKSDVMLGKVRLHQSIIVDFARVSAGATDLQRLLDQACHHAARALGVAHSKVMQLRHEKGDLLMVAGRGWKAGVVGHARLGIDMLSPPGRAYQTRDCVMIANLPADPNFRMSKLLRDHGIVSVLNAPIAVNGMVWGVLEVDSTEQDQFDDDDSRFLLGLALVLALAIGHRQGQAERERSAEELGRRLTQADTLLSEQNHRVRNYFQLILSILANRSRKAANEQLRVEFDEIMDRVTAVALAHDQLTFRGGPQTHVNAASYIDALCLGLERTVEDEVKIERDAEALELRADRAVPVGLILNELLTNAIKYATKGVPDPTIKVRLTTQNSGDEARLEVSDNGPGLSERREGSMGLKLIETLASQLSGRLTVDSSSKGTLIMLDFPLVE